MTRDEVRASTRCPKCRAPAGSHCIQEGKRRKTLHPARLMAAETMGGWKAGKPVNPGTTRERELRRKAKYDRKR